MVAKVGLFEVMDALFDIDVLKVTLQSSTRKYKIASSIEIENKQFKELKLYTPDSQAYSNLTKQNKAAFFFIVNRKLATRLPLQAFSLSRMGISSEFAMDYWYTITKQMADANNGVPRWVYKSHKKTKIELISNRLNKLANTCRDFYIKHNEITDFDFDLALKLEPVEMEKYLKKLSLFLKSTNQ